MNKEIWVVFCKNDICEYVFESEEDAIEFADLDADLYEFDRNIYSIVKYTRCD